MLFLGVSTHLWSLLNSTGINKSTVVSENRTETQNYINLNDASTVNSKQLPLVWKLFSQTVAEICLSLT